MANQEHLDILKQGVEMWNQWRRKYADVQVDLSYANLQRANLREANLSGANLRTARLGGTNLSGANLRTANLAAAFLGNANLRGTNFGGANLSEVDFGIEANLNSSYLGNTDLSLAQLPGADLRYAFLFKANLTYTNLSYADLSHAYLNRAMLVNTNLIGATITDCRIHGIAAWGVKLEEATQKNLVITPEDEPAITADNLEVGQFIYLLLNNPKIRDVINTIGQKGVLILGRFTPERKAVLDAIREKLRSLNFLPIVFDFERPTAHDFTETIMTLAGLSCFIIADITNPESSSLELQATVPNYMTPLVPIIQEGEQPFAMFTDLQNKYRDWVLDTLLYDTPSNLVNVLERAIVKPALDRQAELLLIKAQGLRTRHINDYL
jgi:Pentapeptide repeats (8 copies)